MDTPRRRIGKRAIMVEVFVYDKVITLQKGGS